MLSRRCPSRDGGLNFSGLFSLQGPHLSALPVSHCTYTPVILVAFPLRRRVSRLRALHSWVTSLQQPIRNITKRVSSTMRLWSLDNTFPICILILFRCGVVLARHTCGSSETRTPHHLNTKQEDCFKLAQDASRRESRQGKGTRRVQRTCRRLFA